MITVVTEISSVRGEKQALERGKLVLQVQEMAARGYKIGPACDIVGITRLQYYRWKQAAEAAGSTILSTERGRDTTAAPETTTTSEDGCRAPVR